MSPLWLSFRVLLLDVLPRDGTGEVLGHAMKTWGSGGVAPLVLNLCIRCRRAVSCSPQLPTLPLGKAAVVRIEQEVGRLP
jgi:hypothetical protein